MKAFAIATLAACAPIGAQAISSPRGLLTTEGSGEHGYALGSIDGIRFQQIDASHRGPSRTIKSIAFRRDGALANGAAFGARTLRGVEVWMGHGTIGTVSSNLDGNVRGLVRVFDARNVNAPDWRQRPATGPAPFDLSLTFDRPFVYNGTDDLVWEVRVQSVTPAPTELRNYPFDFERGSAMSRSIIGTSLGQGCLSSGRGVGEERFQLGTEFANHGGQFRMIFGVNYAPDDGIVLAFLSFRDANLTVPGLCTRLHAEPTIILTTGIASESGSLPAITVPLPYDAGAIGNSVFLQAISPDASQNGIGMSLSQGVRMTIPANPPAPAVAHAFAYRSPAGSSFSMANGGGIVARLGL